MRTVVMVLLGFFADAIRGQTALAPPNVASVSVKSRTETELNLEWNKINNISYILRYINGTEISFSVAMDGPTVMYTVSSLSPGTRYTFTLYTVFKGTRSSGFQITAVTTPSNVVNVSVKARSETAITFEWDKVGNSNAYTYILRQNKTETYTPMYWGGTVATHTVSLLFPGTKYTFTLYTLFGGERSSGYNFSTVTMPVSVLRVNVTELYENQLRLSWEKVTGNNISYILRENKMETLILEPDQGSSVNYTVTSHSPGSKYTFTLYTLFEGVRSRGLNFSFVTASVMVTGLRCEQVSSGSALLLVWNAPLGIWREVEVQVHVKGRSPQYTNGTRLEVCDLQPARWYNVSLKLCSGDVRSIPVSVTCQTDPREKHTEIPCPNSRTRMCKEPLAKLNQGKTYLSRESIHSH
ncbi:receptor-type tyrosine-protein phosphatase H-like isoform X2 [Hoplias malabaricus]|uniref:receptor-type tyrosine-protein phosphatase H-like isoform X2 n=1 Tax=Hoplias malabaricus TaxID=27720 RepID=UPI0034636548